MPISWPPATTSLLIPTGTAPEDPDEEDAVEAADAAHGRADRVVHRSFFSMYVLVAASAMPPEIDSRYASDGW